ncbi:LCP family glycopolymer transferase [Homoserinimonas sp. A520]
MSERRARRVDESTPVIARHGRLRRQTVLVGLLKLFGASLVVLLISTLTVAGVTAAQLEANIDSVALVGEEAGPPPELGAFEGGFNVLLVGSDECEYERCPGREGVRNDVTILLHVSQDQQNIVAVSFPRDLIVPIPSCPRPNGEGNYSAMSGVPLNSSMGYGGLPCTVLTIEELTGLDIPFAGVITFNGVVQMSNAIGGVTVCTNGPVVDRLADNINLPKAGTYTLQGVEALGFLRTRHGVGDGSDLGRISNQQVFMSSLVRKIQDEGTLGDPAALYRIATVATQSMTLSNSLKNPTTMIAMAQVLKGLDLSRVLFVQYPTFYGSGSFANKVVPDQTNADKLFEKIQADVPFTLAEDSVGVGAVKDPNAPAPTTEPVPEPETDATEAPTETAPAAPAPEVLTGIEGQSAGDHTCSNAN